MKHEWTVGMTVAVLDDDGDIVNTGKIIRITQRYVDVRTDDHYMLRFHERHGNRKLAFDVFLPNHQHIVPATEHI